MSCCRRGSGKTSSVQMYTAPGEAEGPSSQTRCPLLTGCTPRAPRLSPVEVSRAFGQGPSCTQGDARSEAPLRLLPPSWAIRRQACLCVTGKAGRQTAGPRAHHPEAAARPGPGSLLGERTPRAQRERTGAVRSQPKHWCELIFNKVPGSSTTERMVSPTSGAGTAGSPPLEDGIRPSSLGLCGGCRRAPGSEDDTEKPPRPRLLGCDTTVPGSQGRNPTRATRCHQGNEGAIHPEETAPQTPGPGGPEQPQRAEFSRSPQSPPRIGNRART